MHQLTLAPIGSASEIKAVMTTTILPVIIGSVLSRIFLFFWMRRWHRQPAPAFSPTAAPIIVGILLFGAFFVVRIMTTGAFIALSF